MSQPRTVLNPVESAALTRLVLAYCLGRGSLCLCSRSYSLQLHQPRPNMDFTHYQWRRLRQFLPNTRAPRYVPIKGSETDGMAGQWRLRVSSKYFETAFKLLYPDGFKVSAAVLELLGAEAIASLWADRGRVLVTKGRNYCTGRLNLSRCSFEEAELIAQWIARLTGAGSTLHHGPRSFDAPMLYFDPEATHALLAAVGDTWMAQAPCLQRKFRLPKPQRVLTTREALAAEQLMPPPTARSGSSLLKPNRRIPQLPQSGTPRSGEPPVLKQQGAIENR